MRHQGILQKWKDDKGFGFIEIAGSKKEVFIHIRAFQTKERRPQVGDRLSFVIHPAADGRWHAAEAQIEGQQISKPTSKAAAASAEKINQPKFFLAFGFLLAVLIACVFVGLPWYVLPIYLAWNFVTFIAYATDKGAAERGDWRTKESTLHKMAVVGGWPGALIAQQVYRHKSRKAEFQSTFWLTVVVNALGAAFLLSWFYLSK